MGELNKNSKDLLKNNNEKLRLEINKMLVSHKDLTMSEAAILHVAIYALKDK